MLEVLFNFPKKSIFALIIFFPVFFLINIAQKYAIRRVQQTKLWLDMNGTDQVLAYADDVNLIGDDMKTIERNANVLLNACKNIGLAVNTKKTKYTEVERGIIQVLVLIDNDRFGIKDYLK